MKIIVDFEEDKTQGHQSSIPSDRKLKILARIMKVAHNPAEFVTLEVKEFKISDKP